LAFAQQYAFEFIAVIYPHLTNAGRQEHRRTSGQTETKEQ